MREREGEERKRGRGKGGREEEREGERYACVPVCRCAVRVDSLPYCIETEPLFEPETWSG